LGFNYRMTELQAALGCSQVKRLDQYVARRHELAARYDQLLRDLPVVTPWQHADSYSGLHLYVIRLRLDRIKLTRSAVFDQMRGRGVGVNVHYIPVHLQPYYREMGFNPGDFPESENYYREAISLPMFPTLQEAQQVQVVRDLAEILS